MTWNMRPRLIIRLAVLLAGLHLTLSLGSFWISFSSGMQRFAAADPVEAGPVEAAASLITSVLLQPVLVIWSAIFVGRSGPAILQWVAIVLNSLAWGMALALVLASVKAYLRPRMSLPGLAAREAPWKQWR